MRTLRLTVVLAAILTVVAAGQVQGQVSIGAVQALYIQPGARPAGMGDCFVAIADDATACYWNPAGLAYLPSKTNISLMHSELVPDWGDVYFEYAAAAWRVEGLGTIGATITYLTYGEQPETEPDPQSGDVVVLGTFSSYELIASGAFGTTIGENIAVGLNLKFAYVDLASGSQRFENEGTGVTFAGDVGALLRTSGGRLTLGGAVQHIGPRIAYTDEPQSDPLPRNAKLGIAYRVLDDEMNRFTVSAEYNKSLVIYEDFFDQTTGVTLSAGAEYQYYDLLSLRSGYIYDKDGEVKGLSYGFGIKYGSLVFDWASVPQAEGLTRPFRFSFSGFF